MFLLPGLSLAQDHNDGHEAVKEHGSEKFNPTEMIIHHIKDDYGWGVFEYADEDGSPRVAAIPLPIILWCDGKLDVFSSNRFQHGESVSMGENTYLQSHGHISEVSGKSLVDISITKNTASMMFTALLMCIIFISVAGAYKRREGQAPKGLQSFVEPIIVFVRDEIALPNIGEKDYKRFLPYLLTIFFFIWINNLLGLVPTGANVMGNIAVTMVLAVFTFVVTTVSGKKDYWKHIFATPGVPAPILIIMVPVEIMGMITKPFALMIRLFANITAGHIIILSLLSFIFVFQSVLVGIPAGAMVVVMMMLELFVAVLQAYIFTLLSALFIGQAVETHEEHH